MTEKEKAAAGLLYDPAGDAELCAERLHSQELCFDYNRLRPSQQAEQAALLQELVGHSGSGLCIMTPFHCDYGCNLYFGKNVYINYNCVILDCARVTFGDNVFVAPNCSFTAAGHPLDAAQRNSLLEYAYPITVGNNVWFGANVTVLPGVTIGDGAVIGAGSVVNRDIPAGVVAVGNPCRVLRKITSEDAEKYQRRGEPTKV